MHICFFSNPSSPQTRRVVASLVRRGCRVHVVHNGPGEVPGASYEPFRVPDAGWLHPFRWSRRERRYLTGLLRRHDVVSVQFLHSWGFTPEMMASGCLTVRPMGSDISPPPGGPQPLPTTVRNRRSILRWARGVSVTCDSFRRAVARYAGIEPSSVDLTPLGVDLARFRRRAARAGQPIVGCFKGFGHAYGMPHLVRAIPKILEAVPEASFELVGGGPQLEACRRLSRQLGVAGAIRWIDRVEHECIPAIIDRWSVSVIPSVCESFGIAALESSAMELPVVASRVGGLTETVVDGETGVLVPVGDSGAIAAGVIGLIRDPDRRQALGRQGRRHVEANFEWERCISKWLTFFERSLARRLPQSH